MKFGSIPETILEWLALKSGKVPVPLVDVLFGPMKARVVMASVRLGVIDSLAKAPSTAAGLAASLQLDHSCLEMLLRVLVHCDYLELNGDRYSLSALARRTLAPAAPMDRRGYAEWNYTQWEMLEHLEDMMRSGNGLDLHESLRDPRAWGSYQLAMLENARDHAAYLARQVPVPAGARSLIDLGGSHGLLGAAICRRHPPLRSTVFELEAAVEPARELAVREGIADVATHRIADVLKDDLGSDHDVVLLSNLLHHFSREQNAELLKKLRGALVPKGTIAIWDFERPKPGAKVSGGDAVALYFRLTSSASAYHGDEYAAWLSESAFQDVRVVRPMLSPGFVLVSARV